MVHQYDNNLTLIHRRNPSNEIVAVTLLARPGAVADPEGKLGRTHLMTRLLSKGTRNRSADEIAEELEGMGVRFAASDSYDYVGAAFQCVKSDLGDALEIFADIIKNANFPLDEMETEKQRIYGEIRSREDRSPSATIKRFRQALLGPGPYGNPLEGEPETVAFLTQIDVVTAHQEIFRPENMVISIVGNISADDAKALLEKHFGSMVSTAEAYSETAKSYAPTSSKIDFYRDVDQGFIAMGSTVAPLGDEDSAAIDVATAVLGQGMSARLFRTLRDHRGLAYTVGAFNTQYRRSGFIAVYIGTSPETVSESVEQHGDMIGLYNAPGVTPMDWAASALWNEVEVLSREPVSPEELERAKSYLIGGYLRGHEANTQQAQYLAYWHLMGLGVEYDRDYPELLKKVTSRDVMRVANKYFHDPTTVILKPNEIARK